MDSYIVRIYRRDEDEPGDLAGLVEMVGTSDRLSFRSFPELTSVLRRMLKPGEAGDALKLQQAEARGNGGRSGLNLVAGNKG